MGKLSGENRWNYQFAISSVSKKIKQIIWPPASIAQWEHLYSLWYNKMKQNIVDIIVLSLFDISNWLNKLLYLKCLLFSTLNLHTCVYWVVKGTHSERTECFRSPCERTMVNKYLCYIILYYSLLSKIILCA